MPNTDRDDALCYPRHSTQSERDLLTALVETAYANINELGLYADDYAEHATPAARLMAYGPWRRACAAVAEVCRWADPTSALDDETVASLRAGLHACEAALRLGSAAPCPLAKAG